MTSATGSGPSRARGPIEAVVPVRGLPAGKTRLARLLSVDQRNRLVRAMLEDVVGALQAAPSVERVTIFSRDAAARREAERLEAGFLQQPPGRAGLNPGLAYAQAQRAEAGALLIVPADLPLITAEDVEALVAALRSAPAVAIASADDGGTNGLCLRPPGVIAPAFGADSARLHRSAAERAGARVSRLDSERWALDVDWPEDLARVLRLAAGHQAGQLLHTIRCLRAPDFPAGDPLPAP